jgi:hypothetical protein
MTIYDVAKQQMTIYDGTLCHMTKLYTLHQLHRKLIAHSLFHIQP